MPTKKKKPDFEKSIARLDQIVSQLEEGELTLEQSLKIYQEGITLTRECQKALQEAEQMVKTLTEEQGQPKLESFAVTEAADENSDG